MHTVTDAVMIASTTYRPQERRQQAAQAGARARFQAPLTDQQPAVRAASLPRLPRGEVTIPETPPAPRIVASPARSLPASGEVTVDAADLESDECDERRRPGLEIADVFRAFGPEYRQQVGELLTVQQDRVLRELMVCRTDVLGAHHWMCERCGHQAEIFHSCKNRHCPKCGAYERFLWAEQVQADLLPIEYHHVVVTLPHPLTLLAFDHPRVLYPLVLRTGAEALLRLARRELGVELGVLILLHTWGQLMNRHVHAHSLVSGGGLSRDGQQFIQFPTGEFLALEDLAREFRDLLLKRLDSLYRRGHLVLQGDWRQLDWGNGWQAFLAPLRTIDWVVFSRGVWDRREEVGQRGEVSRAVEYLAHYANRVAMSNSRLLAIEGQEVVFRYRDHRDGGTWRTKSLPGVEFIERFLWHVLPQGLRRIRRFGWWGNAVRTDKIAVLRKLLRLPPADPADKSLPVPPEEATEEIPEEQDQELVHLEAEGRAPHKCRVCGGQLVLLYPTRRPTVAELMRMPPNMEPPVETGPVQLHLPISAFL